MYAFSSLKECLIVQLMDECLLMHLVVELEFLREGAQLLKLCADASKAGDVVVVCAPEGKAPVLVSDAEDRAVDEVVAVLRE